MMGIEARASAELGDLISPKTAVADLRATSKPQLPAELATLAMLSIWSKQRTYFNSKFLFLQADI